MLTGNWGGLRDKLADDGVTFGLIWTGEYFKNFQGGIRPGETLASTTDLNFTLDTSKAFKLPGGKFYVDLENHAGRNPSTALTGDLQVFDKNNYSSYLQVFELYYEQKLFNDTLRIKVGKVDGNSEFSVIDNGLDFIDSSSQISPTLPELPTSPNPMPGANVFFTPTEYFFASFGACIANQRDRFLDFTGHPWEAQPTRGGILLLGETGFKWDRSPWPGFDGNLKLGFWGHTAAFSRLDGGSQNGAEGFYAILDQTLWKPSAKDDDPRGLRMFLGYGETDPKVSQIWQQTGGGLVWKGFLPSRPGDEIGVSPECAWLSRDAALPQPYELIVETFYQTNLTPWATFKPDLQYIVHPGGQYDNALVATLQLTLQF
jgi:porin